MNFKKILKHPFLMIFSFFFIIIIGEHVVGFYLWYILLALPHGSIHAVLAAVGVMALILNSYQRDFMVSARPVINIVAALLLPISLFLFFYNDEDDYNIGTLCQVVPVGLISIWVALTGCFIFFNIKFPNHKI